MAASTRANIMKGKGKSSFKPKKGTQRITVTNKKRKPFYKTKLKSIKHNRAPQYDSSSDEEENTRTQDAVENEEMEVESEGASEIDNDSENETKGKGNEGWADVMTKILNSSKDKKSVILSKAQTDREIAFKKAMKQEDFEVEHADKDAIKNADSEEAKEKKAKPQPVSYKEMKKELIARREVKKCWESMGRVKPDITAKQKERALQRIATKGIVHLFNAVKQRQSTIETKMKEVHGSEVKREKILKSMTKGDFLDVLKCKAKSIPLEDAAASPVSKSAAKNFGAEVKPGWNVFCDDYMIGAKMKDWDKESDSEGGAETNEIGPILDGDMSSSDED